MVLEYSSDLRVDGPIGNGVFFAHAVITYQAADHIILLCRCYTGGTQSEKEDGKNFTHVYLFSVSLFCKAILIKIFRLT